MNVLWVTNGYPSKKHPEFCVFTKDQIEAVKRVGVTGDLYFINAREKGLKAYLSAFSDLKRMNNANKYDAVHAFHGLSFIVVLICMLRRPIVVSFLNAIDNEFKELNKLLSLLMVNFVKLVLKINKDIGVIVKDRLPDYLKKRPHSYYLPNGVDTEYFIPIDKALAKSKLGLSKDKRYILFVSSKDLNRKQKRFDRFNEVIDKIKSNTEFENVEALTVSNVTREELLMYYSASSVHLLTSDFEGSPNSVKEAISCNLPVVSTDVGNVKEMISNIPDCKVSKSSEIEELANLTIDILSSKKGDLRSFIFKNELDANSKSLKLKSIYTELSK